MRQALLPLDAPAPAGPTFELRPYQLGAITAIRDHLRRGVDRLLIALPTGTGKTVVFANLPQALALQGRRVLVLAHREELLDQARAKFTAANPELICEVEQAGRRAHGADVVIASVPTLQRKRLQALDPDEFGLVIVDEAHHAIAKSYLAIFEHFGLMDRPYCRPLIGLTATPTRGDNVGLSSVFDAIAYEMGIRQAIEDGWLAPIAGHRLETGTDISGVHTRAGEFVTKELAEAVNTERRNALIVQSYQDLTPGRRALAFCVDVAHAGELAATFDAAGIRAGMVSGKTLPQERRDILRRFHRGDIDVLCNCAVLTEGFDEPRVDCILMARPIKSSLLYTQMIGRGTRLHPDKTDLQVLDFGDSSERHSLASVATLFGLPAKLNAMGKDVLEVAAKVEKARAEHPWLDLSGLKSVDELKLVATKIDFFNAKPPAALEGHTQFTWLQVGEGYRLALPKKERVDVQPTRLDTWLINFRAEDGLVHEVAEVPNLRDAMTVADRYVMQERHDTVKLVDGKAWWRSQPATDKQIALLRRWGIPHPPGITKGQAASIITMRIEGRRR